MHTRRPGRISTPRQPSPSTSRGVAPERGQPTRQPERIICIGAPPEGGQIHPPEGLTPRPAYP
jgi:hypothetical protein